jgi:beta-galactosidase
MQIDYLFSEGCPINISCDAKVDADLPMLPRFGFKFVLPEGFENVKYFGYGPMEAYQDKRLAARLSVFGTTATDNFEHYVRPQENSAHYGTRWANVSEPYGHGIFFGADEFSFSVSHFSPEYLTSTAHDFELVPQKETTVIIDYRNSGIGSNSCGPELLPQYRIEEKNIKFSFSFSPEFSGRINYFDKWRLCKNSIKSGENQ